MLYHSQPTNVRNSASQPSFKLALISYFIRTNQPPHVQYKALLQSERDWETLKRKKSLKNTLNLVKEFSLPTSRVHSIAYNTHLCRVYVKLFQQTEYSHRGGEIEKNHSKRAQLTKLPTSGRVRKYLSRNILQAVRASALGIVG